MQTVAYSWDSGKRTLLAEPEVRRAGQLSPEGKGQPVMPMVARLWLTMSVGALLLAGLLSLFVVVGRLPALAGVIGDPLFFKRCLVVHVTLALTVWFYAFLCGLVGLTAARREHPADAVLPAGALFGVVLMLGGALVPGAEPVLANYIPVIDHGLFLGGILIFGLSVSCSLALNLLRPVCGWGRWVPMDAVVGLRVAACGVLLAGLTWLASRGLLSASMERWVYFEMSAWGAGHVLQMANVAMMLAIWLWAAGHVRGKACLSGRAAGGLFAVLALPYLALPLLAGIPAWQPYYLGGSTLLMRWGLFPVALVVMALVIIRLRECPPRPEAPVSLVRAGLAAGMGLTLLGFILGAMIRGSTTLVPAHYHAALGGVTAALMMAAYLITRECGQRRGREVTPRFMKAARWQLILFGGGQGIFALGFALGGLSGLGRKAYGADQEIRSLGEYLGLGIMGIGGLVAAAAGILFLVLMASALRHWRGHRGMAV